MASKLTKFLSLFIPDIYDKGTVVTDVFDPNFTKIDQNAETVDATLKKLENDKLDKSNVSEEYNTGKKIEDKIKDLEQRFKNFCPFPVSSLYLSLGNENPSTLWLGTTWQKQENRFLLGAGSSYGLGSTGGSNSISLSASNMPRHRHRVDQTSASVPPHAHNVKGMAGWAGDTGYITMQSKMTTQGIVSTESAGGGSTGSFAPYTDYQGNGSAFSIMPPYLAVNIWKRLS